MNTLISASNKRVTHVPHLIDQMRINGNVFNYRGTLKQIIPRREYILYDIIPSASILSHVFIGFTQNGKYFLSYCKCAHGNNINLHIFNFRGHEPLELVASHRIFSRASYEGMQSFSDSQLSEAVYCYQWPSNDNYLLTFVAPEYPDSRIIDVTLIRIDDGGSYAVPPGTLTFSYPGFGPIPNFCDQESFDDEIILTPKILMSKNNACAFSTDSEVVCLEIKEQLNASNNELEIKLDSIILDVESMIFRDLVAKMKNTQYFKNLSEYELLVYDVEPNPTKIHALLELMFVKNGKKLFHSFLIEWDPKSMVWDFKLFSQNDENEGYKSHYPVMMNLVAAHRKLYTYSVNNLSLAESQRSLIRLDSPVDSVSVILKPFKK